jgi:hypothetical protein
MQLVSNGGGQLVFNRTIDLNSIRRSSMCQRTVTLSPIGDRLRCSRCESEIATVIRATKRRGIDGTLSPPTVIQFPRGWIPENKRWWQSAHAQKQIDNGLRPRLKRLPVSESGFDVDRPPPFMTQLPITTKCPDCGIDNEITADLLGVNLITVQGGRQAQQRGGPLNVK